MALSGKVIVITGGARGMGRAYTLGFLEQGCKVVTGDLSWAGDGAEELRATVESAGGLVLDLDTAMERLCPRGIEYRHNTLNADDNGHSHTRATLIGPSLVVPIAGHQPLLGVWQEIVLIDFDSRPRSRDLVLQFMGE